MLFKCPFNSVMVSYGSGPLYVGGKIDSGAS